MVPGGATVPSSGVTRVGVTPDAHPSRRAHRRDAPPAARCRSSRARCWPRLRASEAVIYGRFGFAVAGEHVRGRDRPSSAALESSHPSQTARIRILDRDDVLAHRDRGRTIASASIDRRDPATGVDAAPLPRRSRWPPTRRHTSSCTPASRRRRRRVGAVRARTGPRPSASTVGGICEVGDVWGATPSVELALWKFILELDLIETVRADERPVDDAVRFALADLRTYHAKMPHRRAVVAAARRRRCPRRRARTTPADGAVTIAVTDPMFPANTGTWRVSADGAARVADHATDDADLAHHHQRHLRRVHGRHRLARTAGERPRRSSVAPVRWPTADVLFASRPLPRCGTFF